MIACLCIGLAACGESASSQSTPALSDPVAKCSHERSVWTVEREPTDIEDGIKNLVCTECGEIVKTDSIPKLASHFLQYKVNPDGETCTVTGCGRSEDGNLYIPSMIDGYKVVSIAVGAFKQNERIKNVVIADTVTEIGGGAFSSCKYLESVKLPSGLAELPDSLFENCRSLRQVNIPDGITRIGYGAFKRCESLKSLVIPDSVWCIDSHAFYECDALISVSFGEGLERIENDAFSRCRAIEKIELPDKVTYIGARAFGECYMLSSVKLPSELIYLGPSAFNACSRLEEVNIPSGMTVIFSNTFFGCGNLLRVSIPDSVVYIDIDAFGNCPKLSYAEFGEGLYLGNEKNPYLALMGTSNSKMTSLELHADTRIIGFGALLNHSYLKELWLSDNLVSVAVEALGGCESLKYTEFEGSLYLGSRQNPYVMLARGPEGVQSTVNIHPDTKILGPLSRIGNGGLTSIEIPEGVVSICCDSLRGNTRLKSLKIPSSVRFIDELAIADCKSLVEIIIPSSVELMLPGAFSYSDSLEKVEFSEGTVIIFDSFFRCGVKKLTIPSSVRIITSLPISDYSLVLEEISYGGTKAEWIRLCGEGLEYQMYSRLKTTVKCSDGEHFIGGGWTYDAE